MNDHGGDLVKWHMSQNGAVRFDFQEAPVSGQVATFLADINDLIQRIRLARVLFNFNVPVDVALKV